MIQRSDHFRRVSFENAFVLVAGLRRQQIHAWCHWHHMHVQMKHDLPAGSLAELLHNDALRDKRPQSPSEFAAFFL